MERAQGNEPSYAPWTLYRIRPGDAEIQSRRPVLADFVTSIEDAIPDHSAFSRARNERFRDGDVFRHMFERVVEACIAADHSRGPTPRAFVCLPPRVGRLSFQPL